MLFKGGNVNNCIREQSTFSISQVQFNRHVMDQTVWKLNEIKSKLR